MKTCLIQSFLIIFCTSSYATDQCKTLLDPVQRLGGDSLGYQHGELVFPNQDARKLFHQFLDAMVDSQEGAATSLFLDVFHPDPLYDFLSNNGMSADDTSRLDVLIKSVAANSSGPYRDQFETLDAGFEILNKYHDGTDSTMNVCVIGEDCSGFTVKGESRPYLNVNLYGTHIGSTPFDGMATDTQQSRVAPPLPWNVVVLNSNQSPESFLVNLFSGTGSALMNHIMGTWLVNLNHLNQHSLSSVSSRFTMPYGEITLVDLPFSMFMSFMSAHVAELELYRMFQGELPIEVFNRENGLFYISTILDSIKKYPFGREFLLKNGINETSALSVFESYRQQILSDLSSMSASGESNDLFLNRNTIQDLPENSILEQSTPYTVTPVGSGILEPISDSVLEKINSKINEIDGALERVFLDEEFGAISIIFAPGSSPEFIDNVLLKLRSLDGIESVEPTMWL